ncbi:MAG: glycosyltransferase [Chloroflexi bacterium]|nr:glycosyltransferase [Chloroflexota bacterium]
MRIIHLLHHSISPFAGQYPDRDPLHYDTGLPMRFARAIRARDPDVELECWRPEHTLHEPYAWVDEGHRIRHRVFPSHYLRYNLELSPPLLAAVREAASDSRTCFLLHGSYNLHTYALASILQRAPVILQSHGGFPARVLLQISRHRWLKFLYLPLIPIEAATLPKYPHIFAISAEEQDYLQRFFPGSQVSFSPTGIDFNHFSPDDKHLSRQLCNLDPTDPIVLYVGRLSAEKGLDYLIEGFPTVVSRFPGARLFIIGSGPLQAALAAQVDRLGLAGRVKFVGHVPNAELPRWYSAADVTVMPSLLEWFGMVAAESMACGTPVVATQAGGAVDIVREFECGILVPPRDPVQLAEGICAVLNGSANTRPNIERARNAFDWSVKLRYLFSLFEAMAAGRTSSR